MPEPADSIKTAYEAVSYPGRSYRYTHPDRLAVMAVLAGMNPTPVEHCRVLEVGCGDGTNLLSMAQQLPNSVFVGVDFAEPGIAEANETARAVGLRNARFEALDLCALSRDFGTFDYIIAHGIYSWVPEPVRQKLLEVCSANLSPNGVSYVSFNANPGSHIRQMLREMMVWHSASFADPQEKVRQARAFANFVRAVQPDQSRIVPVLDVVLEAINKSEDSVVFHDQLAENNFSTTLVEFAAEAQAQGLQLLGEADLVSRHRSDLRPEARAKIEEAGELDFLLQQQLIDFLHFVGFHRCLLCHADLQLNRNYGPDDLPSFRLSSDLKSTKPQAAAYDNSIAEFKGPDGRALSTDAPIAKAALEQLERESPSSVPYRELAERAVQASGQSQAEDQLRAILWAGCCNGLIELERMAPAFSLQAAEKPLASPLARYQIRTRTRVSNLRQGNVEISGALEKYLLQLLDGTRSREQLVAHLLPMTEAGPLSFEEAGEQVRDPHRRMELLREKLDENLRKLARLALLMP